MSERMVRQVQRLWGFFAEHRGHEKRCWLWPPGKTSGWYGRFRVRGRLVGAHRWVWQRVHGQPIPAGKFVCHRCDRPPCVNPQHLFLGDARLNALDAVRKGRMKPLPRLCGSQTPLAKLDEATVQTIRTALARGATSISLARRFGVHASTIGSIRRGERWTHVPLQEA